MNWDDLKILIAVRDAASFAGAGRRLGMNETTISRRLSRLESSIGTKLFTAKDGLRRPTDHCNAVLEHAEEAARQISAIGSITVGDQGVTGHVRLAMTPLIADEVLAPHTASFLLDNPGITLEFLTSGKNINFARWESDLAIRLARPTKGNFSISKLATIRNYYFEPLEETIERNWPLICSYPEYLNDTPESRFLVEKGIKTNTRLVTENLATIRQLLLSNSAAGILPEYACGELLNKQQLKVIVLPQGRDIWLLVQPHLKNDAATRKVIDWVKSIFYRMRAN